MKKRIFILILAVIFFSCQTTDNESDYGNIEFSLIASGNLNGAGSEGINSQNMVITNQTSWNELISQMNTVNDVSDTFIETDIDFSKYQIIAVFDEVRRYGGHTLDLDISCNSQEILVQINYPTPEGNTLAVITQPYMIVKIHITNKPIFFE